MTDSSKALPGALRWPVGDLTVTVLNDGYLQGSLDLVAGISKEEAGSLQAAGFRAQDPRITLNAFLITGPGRKPVLIDAGMGSLGGPTLGHVPAALAFAGVRPEEIGTVLVSHLHPDHVGGLIDERGQGRYPNAEIVLHTDEAAHWLGEDALARAPEGAKSYFENARNAVAPYGGRCATTGAARFCPASRPCTCPATRRGTRAFRIVSGDKSLFSWTDVVHLPAIQFKQPEAGMVFDVDVEQARETRKRVLDMVANDRSFIAGNHLEFPALGYVARDGAAYSFVPELWVAAQ